MPGGDKGQNLGVWTRQVWIQNGGNAPVDEIEVVLNHHPQHFEFWPPRPYETRTLDVGREVILVRNLAPRENLILALLESRPDVQLPDVLVVRSKTDVGKQVPLGPQRIYPTWINLLVLGVLLFGIGSLTQFIFLAAIKLYAVFSLIPS